MSSGSTTGLKAAIEKWSFKTDLSRAAAAESFQRATQMCRTSVPRFPIATSTQHGRVHRPSLGTTPRGTHQCRRRCDPATGLQPHHHRRLHPEPCLPAPLPPSSVTPPCAAPPPDETPLPPQTGQIPVRKGLSVSDGCVRYKEACVREGEDPRGDGG